MSNYDWFEMNMGVTDISAEAVRLANSKVPFDFDEACRLGLVDEGINAKDFVECRKFLRDAAKHDSSINGSW